MFLSFCVLNDFFRFSKKSCFGVFLVHPPMASVLLYASVERCFVSRMRDFGPMIVNFLNQYYLLLISWTHQIRKLWRHLSNLQLVYFANLAVVTFHSINVNKCWYSSHHWPFILCPLAVRVSKYQGHMDVRLHKILLTLHNNVFFFVKTGKFKCLN